LALLVRGHPDDLDLVADVQRRDGALDGATDDRAGDISGTPETIGR
jgi:hypothetical protein